MGFDSERDFAPPPIFLGLLLCSWMWGISSQLLECHATAAPAPTILLGLLWPWTWGISPKPLLHHTATTQPVPQQTFFPLSFPSLFISFMHQLGGSQKDPAKETLKIPRWMGHGEEF